MFRKILLCICFMRISQGVFVDQSDNRYKDLIKHNPHGWQVVKMYHPANSQAFGHTYEPYAYPKYEFEYSVSDDKTGDHKHHHETRDGDRVRGEYSLVESDGSLRKVQYHADDHNGFNAIVSKTVNKHGNHAVSITDHTRFFYPVGHGIKINHYFPGKNYHYQNLEKMEKHNDTRPVYEEKETAVAEEPKMLLINTGDKIMLVEQEQAKETASSHKPEVEEAVQIVPAIVSEFPQTSETDKINNEISLPTAEPTDVITSKQIPPIPEEQSVEKKDPTTETVEQNLDSEVASSHYYSKIYYVGF